MKAKEARKYLNKAPVWGSEGGIGKHYAETALEKAEAEITKTANDKIEALIEKVLVLEKQDMKVECPINNRPLNGKDCSDMDCDACKELVIKQRRKELKKNYKLPK